MMAVFTCSTAVVCCWVLSSFSRATSRLERTSSAMRRKLPATSENCSALLCTALEPSSVAMMGGVGGGADFVDERADVLGGPAHAVRQLANLLRHHGEALAMLARPRRSRWWR
jgi:hypothetical protein